MSTVNNTAQVAAPPIPNDANEPSGVTSSSAAFGQLVAQNIDFVWRTLRRLGVPAAEVDDATQQVFLVANDKLRSIRAGSERAFLVGVATRVASHARRADQRRLAAQQRLSENPPPEGAPDPEHLTQRMQARDLLDEVLDKMPQEVRTVFVLFELEELSVDEIASLLSLPRGTVATRLRRSRELFHRSARTLQAQQQGERL